MLLRFVGSRFAACSACAILTILVVIASSLGRPPFEHSHKPDLCPTTSLSASFFTSVDLAPETVADERSSAPSLTRTPGTYYKTSSSTVEHTAYPVVEHFPCAATAKSPRDLHPIPPWNTPPSVHVEEITPLFIGFTRNWPLLQQAVIGYITAGWPPEDIYVVENTGTMLSNAKGLLNQSNPFYLHHHRLKDVFGVNLIATPALLSFAQLQNLYLYEAINRNWSHYFWSHMDVLPQSWEDRQPYRSLYMRAVDVVQECLAPGYARDDAGQDHRWGLRYLSYDWLTLMNTATLVELGGWDSMISYYGSDCDMYERMRMLALRTDIADVGKIWDVGHSLPNLELLYRVNDSPNGTAWHELQAKLELMQNEKVHGNLLRNSWQTQQRGGVGQPFFRNIAGFEEALEITTKAGEAVYQKKWGTGSCALRDAGLRLEDQWRIEQVID